MNAMGAEFRGAGLNRHTKPGQTELTSETHPMDLSEDEKLSGETPTVTTLADVARRAGVGESTVSRVLRNKGSVSQHTREKILKVAADLNYVPNRIAGTLASMTSKLV